MPDRPITAANDGEPSMDAPSSKQALGDSAPQRPMDAPGTVPRGYMASTWHKDTNLLSLLLQNPIKAILYDLMYRGPQTKVSGKIPVHTNWAQHVFVFPRTLPPMLYQYWCMRRGEVWSLPWAMTVYIVYFILFSKMALNHFNRLVEKYGTLDSNSPRDQVPDSRVISTGVALIAYAAVRPVVGVLVTFDPKEMPHLSPWLPVHLFVFTTLMDFYFYVYHRAMHEVDYLWRFHKVHHMSKHPSSILSAFADTEQDVFDIFVIPGLTLLTYRVDFFTWWICQVYILFVEASGHSGLRLFIQAPVGSPILQYLGMDLALEDHDLHHRQGWRKSANYGKQTRVWDYLFGSTRKRVECVPDNIDWSNRGDWIDMLL